MTTLSQSARLQRLEYAFQRSLGHNLANDDSGVDANDGNSIWAIGDSLTIRSADTTVPDLSDDCYIAWACMLSNQRLRFGGVAGFASHTGTILAALPNVLSARPRPAMCIVNGGTNDPGQPFTIAQTKANLLSMYTQLANVGIMPILSTIPPRSTFQTQVAQINLWIQRFGAATGCPVLDFHSWLVDPATGLLNAAYDTGDGLHQNAAGSKLMGTNINTQLAGLVPYATPYLTDINTDPINISNGLFLNSAANLPTGWALSSGSAATLTVAADAAILGNAWTIARGAGGTGFYDSPSVAAVPGDRIHFAVKALGSLQGTGGFAALGVRSNIGSAIEFGAMEQATPFWKTDFGWQTLFGEFPVKAAGTTSVFIRVAIGGATNATLKLAQPTLINLTTNSATSP